MRSHLLSLAAGIALLIVAQPMNVQAQPAETDTVVAKVDGVPVTLGDVLISAQDVLPAEMRQMPPQMLLQALPPDARRQLIERAVTERALNNAARAAGLDKNPEVRRRIQRAEDLELQQAYLSREVSGAVTEEALRARYDQEAGKRQSEEEVHARHILVKTEAEAKEVLAELAKGGDFGAIAKARSTDPGAKDGGDLGFFKRGDMVPEFAEAAFALKPGQVSPAPVKSNFGWHIIKVEERRTAPVASYEEARPQLRQQMIESKVEAVVQKVRAAAKIEMVETPAAAGLLDSAAPPGRVLPQRR